MDVLAQARVAHEQAKTRLAQEQDKAWAILKKADAAYVRARSVYYQAKAAHEKASVGDSFNSLVGKLERGGKSKEYATKIAGKVANEQKGRDSGIKKTYIVKALNLNDFLVSQKIEAYSEKQASEIVTKKNKYLRVQSVEVANEQKGKDAAPDQARAAYEQARAAYEQAEDVLAQARVVHEQAKTRLAQELDKAWAVLKKADAAYVRARSVYYLAKAAHEKASVGDAGMGLCPGCSRAVQTDGNGEIAEHQGGRGAVCPGTGSVPLVASAKDQELRPV